MIPAPFCTIHMMAVLGYTMTLRFDFINGVREPGIDVLRMDCGCEITGPDMEVADASALEPGLANVTIRDYAGSPVLSFYDRFEEAA